MHSYRSELDVRQPRPIDDVRGFESHASYDLKP
jgi:hypothetical protein